jgi:Peptidase family S41
MFMAHIRQACFALLIVAAMCALAGAASAQAEHSPDADEIPRWGEDLDFLAREMPSQHANLFHAIDREQFQDALNGIRNRLPSLARSQVIVELQRLAASIGDGHTNVSPWRDPATGFQTLPVTLYRFSGGYYIRAATREHQALLGARVTHIGSHSINAAEALVAPLVGRDNAMAVWLYAPLLLTMPEVLHALGMTSDPSRVRFGLDLDGTPQTVRLDAAGPFPNLSGDADKSWNARSGWVDLRDRAPAPLWLSRTSDTYWFSHVSEGRMLYVQLNEIQERGEKLDAFFARALAAADSAGAERLVLDLRLNGGGNGYNNRPIVRALLRSRFDEPGRLYVITGRRTFSAAGMLIDELEKWTNPVFVGEPSSSRGNHYGDSRKLVLPNNRVTVRVSSLWWQLWDPRDTRPWIAPEVAAPLTLEAYASGHDPALEAIARFVPGPSLAERLKPVLIAGDGDAAWAMIDAFRRDPINAWLDPASSLARLSRQLQRDDDPDAAALAERLRTRLPEWSMPR